MKFNDINNYTMVEQYDDGFRPYYVFEFNRDVNGHQYRWIITKQPNLRIYVCLYDVQTQRSVWNNRTYKRQPKTVFDIEMARDFLGQAIKDYSFTLSKLRCERKHSEL